MREELDEGLLFCIALCVPGDATVRVLVTRSPCLGNELHVSETVRHFTQNLVVDLVLRPQQQRLTFQGCGGVSSLGHGGPPAVWVLEKQ